MHKRGYGAFVPEEFVATDTKRIRSNVEADIHIRGKKRQETPHNESYVKLPEEGVPQCKNLSHAKWT